MNLTMESLINDSNHQFLYLLNRVNFILFIYFYFIFKLYNIVLVLPNIEMNPPQVYTCSPSWTLLPPYFLNRVNLKKPTEEWPKNMLGQNYLRKSLTPSLDWRDANSVGQDKLKGENNWLKRAICEMGYFLPYQWTRLSQPRTIRDSCPLNVSLWAPGAPRKNNAGYWQPSVTPQGEQGTKVWKVKSQDAGPTWVRRTRKEWLH